MKKFLEFLFYLPAFVILLVIVGLRSLGFLRCLDKKERDYVQYETTL